MKIKKFSHLHSSSRYIAIFFKHYSFLLQKYEKYEKYKNMRKLFFVRFNLWLSVSAVLGWFSFFKIFEKNIKPIFLKSFIFGRGVCQILNYENKKNIKILKKEIFLSISCVMLQLIRKFESFIRLDFWEAMVWKL